MNYRVTYKSGEHFDITNVIHCFKDDTVIVIALEEGNNFYNIDSIESVELLEEEHNGAQ